MSVKISLYSLKILGPASEDTVSSNIVRFSIKNKSPTRTDLEI